MGREIRRVPPNFKHPEYVEGEYKGAVPERAGYKPMYEWNYLKHLNEWIENHKLWEAGKHPDQDGPERPRYLAQWEGNPPSIDDYNTLYTEAEATWYQLYENVSEGTPITPPFETPEELIKHLTTEGDTWGNVWSVHAAEDILKSGYVPSMMIAGGVMAKAHEIADLVKETEA